MLINVYCVKDRQVDSFQTPIFMLAHGQAIRAFTDEVNRNAEDNLLYRHPDDYDLYWLGQFDSETGNLLHVEHEVLALGQNVKLKS